MTTRLGAPVVLVLLASLAPGASARGQALASPFGTVTQRIDSTTISVEYYRPSMRGRAIFGSLVRWGVLWTPGANWGTTLQVNHDVTFGGQPLPAGKYTLWMIPGPREWIVTVSRAVPRFHMLRPGPSDEQLRFTVAADSAPPLEMLTFTFPEVTPDGTTLRFQWAGTVVSMPIRVHGGAAAPAAAHPLGSYAGVYAIRDAEDTAAAAGRYEITLEGTRLRVRTDPQWVEEGLDPEFDLMAAGGDGFHARQYKNGVVVGTEADELITFRFEDGRVVGFEIRGMAENRVLARAVLACPGGRCG